MNRYHLYNLQSMGADIPEVIELESDLQGAIAEVIAVNAVNGAPNLVHGTDFRLVQLKEFQITDGHNVTSQWAESADQAARLFLLETFDTHVTEIH